LAGEDDQSSPVEHERKAEVAAREMRPNAHLEIRVPPGHRLLPELRPRRLVAVAADIAPADGVAHEQIEAATFGSDSLEQILHLRVGAVVATDCDAADCFG